MTHRVYPYCFFCLEADNYSIATRNYFLKGRIMKRTVPQSVFDSKDALRVAREGHREACEELSRKPRHMLDEGNPNHPMYDNKIFGYEQQEFMAKQYS